MNKALLRISFLASLFCFQPAARALTVGDLGPYFSFSYGDGGGIPDDVTNVAGQQIIPDGVKLYGTLGPIDGARFRSNFVLYWSGPIEGVINPGDKYFADVTFDAQATGGALAWNFFSEMWSNEGFEAGRIFTDLVPVPESGQVVGAHLESSPFTQPGGTGYFQGYLHLDWTGYSPTDTLTVTIPQDSIDLTYAAVPEPSAMFLAVTAYSISAGLRRRRRRV